MKKFLMGAAAAAALAAAPAWGADPVKIGMITTLSGPGAALGNDIRDGFELYVKRNGGKLGGVPVQLVIVDDGLKPETGRQMAERLVKRDRAQILTGIVFSNVALAAVPLVLQDNAFYVSANAGPHQFAGQNCHPNYFNVAWQNDNLHEAMGKYVQDKGYKRVYLLAPNYPAGKDALTGFKRYYTAPPLAEIYTKLDQLDYAAELAALRAARPDAVYFFLPGGLGVNFIKQYAQAGLASEIPLFGPAFSFDQTTLAAVGEPALGMYNTSQWSADIGVEANRVFVEAFEEAYGRLPSLYASQGYDAAQLIASGLKAVDGDMRKKDAFREALRKADFPSVRGKFKFNGNHHPIQDVYVRQVVKDEKGGVTNRIVNKAFENHADAYVGECKMK